MGKIGKKFNSSLEQEMDPKSDHTLKNFFLNSKKHNQINLVNLIQLMLM
jgi:hypothetical protein